jgi:hypothetical protein
MGSVTVLVIVLLLVFPETATQARTQRDADYAASNSMSDNVQASRRIVGPAMEPGRTDYCNQSAAFKGNAESMIAVDPNNPAHLVGTSQFIHNLDGSLQRFSAYDGVEISTDGGRSWNDQIIPGFDCTQKEKATNQTIYRTSDPVVAFGPGGNLYATILPVSRVRGEERVTTLYVVKSSDGGVTWAIGNGGKPVFNGTVGKLPDPNGEPDKPWIIVDDFATSRFRGTIYTVWTVFYQNGNSTIFLSKSMDGATTFTTPVEVSPSYNGTAGRGLGSEYGYVFAMPGVAADGTLYVNFVGSCYTCFTFDEIVVKSTDGGNSFGNPTIVGSVTEHVLPNTDFRLGIPESFAVNPVNEHLFLAAENATKTLACALTVCAYALRSDILLYESSDGGQTWSMPLVVNDNMEDVNTFQPVVSVSPNGVVAVSFYDRRLPCPNEAWVLPEDVGMSNLCVDTSIQFFSDQDSLKPIGHNIRVTKSSWDPNNSGSLARGGVHLNFIGDYFGLAMTNVTAYAFFAANYDLGGNPTYDTQIFVGRVDLSKVSFSSITGIETLGPIIAVVGLMIVMLFYLIRRKGGR